MKTALCLGIVLLAAPLALNASQSYYPAKLDDPAAVYLTKDNFPVHADGVSDDSAALQAAVDKVEDSHGEGILFIPEGKYRVTRTIYVWPSVRMIGYGSRRPEFLLADNTPGYQQDIAYMFFFTGGRPGGGHWHWHLPDGPRPPFAGTVPATNTVVDANPGTFYSAMSNVDFDLGNGNPAAVAIRFHGAQHCYLAHIDFHIKSGLTALKDVGNEAEDLHFFGGDYGIVTIKPSPGWQFTLLDSTFEGQRKAAISEHEAGLTLDHDSFRNVAKVIDIDPQYYEELWVKNSRFENISGPAITISNEQNPRTEINLENIACHHVPVFATLRVSGQKSAGPAEDYVVKSYTHGLIVPAPGLDGEIGTSFDAAPSHALPPKSQNIIASLPPMDTWVNLHTLGAKGDGVNDDTAAIQKAIDEHRVLYIPEGRYVVMNTLHLKPDTVLIGLHPSTTQIEIPDGTPAFQGPGAPVPLLETPKGGHNIVTGIGLYTNGINERAVGAFWQSGADSLMDDVRFLGGHGTNAADGTRIDPYNNTHTADPDIHRRWDAQYPSLWITNGGGGTFADIWTPSTFAQAGLYISNTSTPGRVYELSSEHHVRTEVKLDRVENWDIIALQTEEERGESGFALPLEISRSRNINVANYHGYRVISSFQPFCCAVKVSESSDIRIRNMHTDSNSKVAFDNSVVDSTSHAEIRPREFALLDIPGKSIAAERDSAASVLEPGAHVERLATGFFNISGAATDNDGQLYFVDAQWQRIFRWSPDTHEAVVVRDTPLEPVNLVFDNSGDLLVVSYAGKGTVYSFRPGSPADQLTMLAPQAAAPRPDMVPVRALDAWESDGIVTPRPYQYISPDRSIFMPAAEDFVQGTLSWGTKMADILHAFGIAKVVRGHSFYVSDEAQEKTYRVNVTDSGTISDMQLFADVGGESVTQDTAGNVYLAAGQVQVFSSAGKIIGRIDIPERPIDLVFGGPDHHTLFILTHASLYSVRTKSPGL
ncbi:MAG: glycosyl hydrolase family 28-related protein [Acidobacteriaceae bacterium]